MDSQSGYILGALIFGAVFGFLLQRARITRFDKQVSMLLLRDMTVLKFFLSAAIGGMLLLLILAGIDFVEIPERPVVLGRLVFGGLIYGIGWAILGYCPGSQLGALGEGRFDAFWGILGSLAGATVMLFNIEAPRTYLYKLWDLGQESLDVKLGVDPWLILAVMAVCCLPLFYWLERRKV